MKRPSISASARATRPSNEAPLADAWTRLANEWQSAGQQWTNWWIRSANASNDALRRAHAEPEAPVFPVVTPTVPVAGVPADVLADINRRYQRKFEALWSSVMFGSHSTEAEKPTTDRRFAAKAWSDQPYFVLLRDSYLLYCDYIREIADRTDADPGTRKKLSFVADQFINAIAPSNFLATNPEALALALESGGLSIAQGARRPST